MLSRRSRRARRVVLVLVVIAASVLPGVLGSVSASAADLGCPSGSFATLIPGSGGWSNCLDLNGVSSGRLDVNGNLTKAFPSVTATPLSQPSSVLAAANGSGGLPPENAALAAANGGEAAGGRLLMATRALSTGTAIVSAGFTGYMIGQGIDQAACSFGLSALCMPSKAPNVNPNADVTVTTGDPGWTGDPTAYTVGWPAGGYAGGNCSYTVSIAWQTNDTLPDYGTTTLPHNVVYAFKVSNRTGSGDCATSTSQPFYVAGYVHCQGGGWVSSMGSVTFYSTGVEHPDPGTAGWALPGTTEMCGDAAPLNGGIGEFCVLRYVGGTPADGCAGYYYPNGNPSRPPAQSPDPARHLVATNDCVDGSGNHSSTTASSATFTETDATYPAYPVAPACPAGTTLAGSKVVETTSGLPDKLIWSVTIPTPITDAQTKYPECGDGSCRLGLWKVNGTTYANCFVASTDCGSWFTDPNKASDYQCTYGPGGATTYNASQDVALSECNVYSPTFDAEKQATGDGYGDPSTGADPGTGSDSSPVPGQDGSSCFPGGFLGTLAAGPVEWVLRPVKCALAWAFMPDMTQISEAWGQARDTFLARPPFSLIPAFASLVSGVVSGYTNGCGPDGVITDFHIDNMKIPCANPIYDTSSFQVFYGLMEAFICGMTALGIWRMVEDSMSA